MSAARPSAKGRSRSRGAEAKPPAAGKHSAAVASRTQHTNPFANAAEAAAAAPAAAASNSGGSDESVPRDKSRVMPRRSASRSAVPTRSQGNRKRRASAPHSPPAPTVKNQPEPAPTSVPQFPSAAAVKDPLEVPLASPSIKFAAAPVASAASCWPIPQLEELRASGASAAPLSRHPFDEQIKLHKKPRSSSRPPQRQQERWLLLACADMLKQLDISRGDEILLSLASPLEIITTLLDGNATDVTAREETQGFTAMHLLVLSALSHPPGLARFKRDSAKQDIDLSKVRRYTTTEPMLIALLQASKAAGFRGGHRAEQETTAEPTASEGNEEMDTAASMLDVADNEGRTPLDWAINHRRPDLVALLLLHGASVGRDEWRKLQWDPIQPGQEPAAANHSRANPISKPLHQTTAASPSNPSAPLMDQVRVHPLVAAIDSSVYVDAHFHDAQRYGCFFREGADEMGQPIVRGEGWCIESLRRKGYGESKEAACKRLLFQHALLQAAEADPYGDADEVHRLVELWLADEPHSSMHPLCYRADGFWISPLQIAVAYDRADDEFDNAILFDLLRLPHSFHIQSASKEWTALTKAILANNREGADMMLKAGYNINQRDVATGRTAFFNAAVELPETHQPEEVKSLLRFLVDEHDADVTLADDSENTIIHLFAFLGQLPSLIGFIAKRLGPAAMEALVERVNSAGSTAMHIALANAFEEGADGAADVEVVRQLSMHSARVDGPVNLAGHTPLHLFAGRSSDAHVPELARILQLSEHTLRAVRHPTRKVIGPLQHVCNTGAVENPPVELWSRYEHDRAEMQSTYFRYITQHRATDYPSQHFIEQTVLMPQAHVDPTPAYQADRFRVPFESLQVRFVDGKGWGLFAVADIDPTQYLEVFGELLSAGERDAREREYLQRGHLGILSSFRVQNDTHEFFIDQTRYGNLTRYINHSCSPTLKVWTSHNKRRVMLWPMHAQHNKGIKAGTELTINYDLFDECAKTPVPRCIVFCRCGEEECTRTII